MKNTISRTILCLSWVLCAFICFSSVKQIRAKNVDYVNTGLIDTLKSKAEEEGFDFIKSKEETVDLLYDGTILLYGGIVLIAISISGIIIMLVPRRPKTKKHSKRTRRR